MGGARIFSYVKAEYPTFLSILAGELPRRYGTAMAFLQFASAGIVFLSVTRMGWLVESLGETRFWSAMLAPGADGADLPS